MKQEQYSIYDLGYDRNIAKVDNFYNEIARVANVVEDGVNPISIASGYMSGNYDLVDGHIESSNFVSGSAGWQITAEGDAEFNSVTVRGTIYATVGDIGGWNINATTIYSDSDEIILDSANTTITVGASNPITIDGANKRIRSDNYVSGYAGSGFSLDEDLLEVGNIACRGLIRTAVFQKDVISSVGGNFMVIDSDMLNVDMTALDASTLTTKATTTFSVGDILRIKDGTDDEWFEVTAVNGAVYTVTRDKNSDYGADANPVWKKGATVVNYGQSGDGGIYMTASESNAPYLSVFTHAGSPWTDLTTRMRIGNLNGYLGYSSDLYGIGIGDATHYLKYDPTNHLRIRGSIDASTITGTTITGGTVQTSTSTNTGVKMTAAGGLDVYGQSCEFRNLSGELRGVVYATEGDAAAGIITLSGDAVTVESDTYNLNLKAGYNIVLNAGAGYTIRALKDFEPFTDNGVSLGSSTKEWKDLFIDGTAQVDTLRIDQTPTAEVNTATHYATVNFNGTNYKVLLKSI